jgi:hypothetical protein
MPDLDLSAAEAAASSDSSAVSSAASDSSGTPSVSSSSPSQSSAVSATSSVGAGTSSAAQSGGDAQAAWSLRQELSGLGIDANAHADDKAAWSAFKSQLAEQVKQLQQTAQYGQYYLANQQKIAAAMAAHEAQAAQQRQAASQPEQKKWWNVPEWKDEFSKFLTQDKNGNVVAVPGADPSLPLKYQAYQQWQAETFKKFLHDPIETLKPGLEEMIQAKATELINKHLGGYQDHELAQRYVHSAPWMFKQGADGQRALNPHTGRPELSDAGRRFAQYVQYAERNLGIRDVQAQARYAQDQVQREYLLADYQRRQSAAGQQQPETQAAEAANNQLKNQAINRGRGASRLPNSGALGANPPVNKTPAGNQDVHLSLEDRLTKSFKQNGVQHVG